VRRTLVDTECWLWWHLDPERLGPEAMALLEERRSPLLLSAASSWEIAIKVGLGKLELPVPPERFVPEQMAEDGIDPLPIEHAHALRVARLPPHHSDPFDRLLVAQAQLERDGALRQRRLGALGTVDAVGISESEPEEEEAEEKAKEKE